MKLLPPSQGPATLIVAALFALLSLQTAACAKSAMQDTERVLHAFTGGDSGENPWGALVFDAAGNLYGTTFLGGSTAYCPDNGCGLVYKLSRTSDGNWKSSAIHIFQGVPDGANPLAGLMYDGAGNFYGTTSSGGNASVCQAGSESGCGTVFRLSLQSGKWNFTLLHTFTGAADGAHPEAGLIGDSAGNLYGTTSAGGTHEAGVVFELSPTLNGTWKLTTLHSFSGTDGQSPIAALRIDTSGHLYGTTEFGGKFGYGVVFELSPAAGSKWKYQPLFSFHTTDGAEPASSLIGDAAGNLYGTTVAGGAKTSLGVVYKLSPSPAGSWSQKVIYDAGASGTGMPGTSLIFDARGDLYGTLATGGDSNDGAVFRLSASAAGWKMALVYSFKGTTSDGLFPEAGVVFDHSGNLYGTAFGSQGQDGVVFELSPAR